jgi:hypothetical protein
MVRLYNNLNEGPLEGEESAMAYKAMTPGQENAENVPYDDDSDLIGDEIKQLMVAVASKIMGLGLQESIVRYATKWETVKEWLELYEEKGIDNLIEHCIHLDQSRLTGKPLRSIIKENLNPDDLMEDKNLKTFDETGEEVLTELSKKTLGKYINKALSDTGNSATVAGAQMRTAAQLNSDTHRKSAAKYQKRVEKRRKGVSLATKKLVKETDSVDEAALGGEKYKGKENPNNEKTRNPPLLKKIFKDQDNKNQERSEKAWSSAIRNINPFGDSGDAKSIKKRFRLWDKVQAAELVAPEMITTKRETFDSVYKDNKARQIIKKNLPQRQTKNKVTESCS